MSIEVVGKMSSSTTKASIEKDVEMSNSTSEQQIGLAQKIAQEARQKLAEAEEMVKKYANNVERRVMLQEKVGRVQEEEDMIVLIQKEITTFQPFKNWAQIKINNLIEILSYEVKEARKAKKRENNEELSIGKYKVL